jgi:hypothetical protein
VYASGDEAGSLEPIEPIRHRPPFEDHGRFRKAVSGAIPKGYAVLSYVAPVWGAFTRGGPYGRLDAAFYYSHSAYCVVGRTDGRSTLMFYVSHSGTFEDNDLAAKWSAE